MNTITCRRKDRVQVRFRLCTSAGLWIKNATHNPPTAIRAQTEIDANVRSLTARFQHFFEKKTLLHGIRTIFPSARGALPSQQLAFPKGIQPHVDCTFHAGLKDTLTPSMLFFFFNWHQSDCFSLRPVCPHPCAETSRRALRLTSTRLTRIMKSGGGLQL